MIPIKMECHFVVMYEYNIISNETNSDLFLVVYVELYVLILGPIWTTFPWCKKMYTTQMEVYIFKKKNTLDGYISDYIKKGEIYI